MTSKQWLLIILIVLGSALFAACASTTPSIDEQLQKEIEAQKVTALDPGPAPDEALVALGQALFFDKVLSGNRDISCSSCHLPTQGIGDGLAVSIGTGGEGVGPERQIGYGREFIPRNAPEVFNRGSEEWVTMFWDSRVRVRDGRFITPAGNQLPEGLDSVLAAQAMFPVTSADEMRGAAGDMDVFGVENEMAVMDGADFQAIWSGLMARLLQYPDYVALFEAAYPDVPVNELGFQHAANAIAAFEIKSFTLTNSPWNNYLNGDTDALTEEQKEGALLFYTVANCSSCHTGSLLTDQQHHNIATPQVGPGKGEEAPFDLGRWRESGDESDMYAFRTPSLHNVATSFPYMHDGAYQTLEAAVLHHLDPEQSLRNYDPEGNIIPDLYDTFQDDPELIEDMLKYVDPALAPDRELTEAEIDNLIAFLHALTDPNIANMAQFVPDSVPSNLPVDVQEVDQDAN